MADLVTLSEVRAILGIDPTNTRDDAAYTALIPGASDLIKSYTERSFGDSVVTEERTFDYDGSGYLDIDDATDITLVKLAYPYGAPDITLTTDDWKPMPSRRADAPVYTYIDMPAYVGAVWGSPEMGFANNLDVYARERGSYGIPPRIKVTGTWGWTTVPEDIKLAAAWLVQSIKSRPISDGLSSEAIEGWSRSWGMRAGSSAASLAIPEPVRDILARYSRIEV